MRKRSISYTAVLLVFLALGLVGCEDPDQPPMQDDQMDQPGQQGDFGQQDGGFDEQDDAADSPMGEPQN